MLEARKSNTEESLLVGLSFDHKHHCIILTPTIIRSKSGNSHSTPASVLHTHMHTCTIKKKKKSGDDICAHKFSFHLIFKYLKEIRLNLSISYLKKLRHTEVKMLTKVTSAKGQS